MFHFTFLTSSSKRTKYLNIFCPQVGTQFIFIQCFSDMYSDSTSRSFVLAGFYIGYASSQVIFSWLAGLWGPKFTLQVAVFLWAFAGLSTIWLVEYKIAVFITRVIIGLAEGANYPCQQTFFSWWIPNQERSGSWGGICSGEAFGTIVALLTCPYLSHEFGWRSIL